MEQFNNHVLKKKEPRTKLHILHKNNSKQITELNVKCKTIKILEKNIGENLQNLRVGKEFLDLSPKI